jgi:hypothetical protein
MRGYLCVLSISFFSQELEVHQKKKNSFTLDTSLLSKKIKDNSFRHNEKSLFVMSGGGRGGVSGCE